MMTEILTTKYIIGTRVGTIGMTIFNSGNTTISLHLSGLMVDIHLTREDVVLLSKNLEEIVAEYDATVDRYHDVCDEPAVPA